MLDSQLISDPLYEQLNLTYREYLEKCFRGVCENWYACKYINETLNEFEEKQRLLDEIKGGK